MSSLRLGVNVDHIATLRQARYSTMPESKNVEPDPRGGGRHMRTGRRRWHRRTFANRSPPHSGPRYRPVTSKYYDEAESRDGKYAKRLWTSLFALFPMKLVSSRKNGRKVTTEGGLDVIAQPACELETTIKRLHVAGIRVSLFIDPDLEQIDAPAGELGVEMVELHTGKLANAFTEKIRKTGN